MDLHVTFEERANLSRQIYCQIHAAILDAEVNQGTNVPGERVDTWFWNGTLSEVWSEVPRAIGGVSYENAGSHFCLDTVGGAGSELMQWPCDPYNRAQAWLLVRPS
jgi:hypothetical protein